MQIMLISKSLIIALLLLSTSVYAGSFPNEPIYLRLNDGSSVAITKKVNKLKAKYQKNKRIINFRINTKLIYHFTKTDEIYLLLKVHTNKEQFLILSREPSRHNRSASFCGSGYEDYILLIEVANNKISLLDIFLLQSCLKSILLSTDQGDDPLQAITINKKLSSISFQWLGDNDNKTRVLTVENGHFIVQ